MNKNPSNLRYISGGLDNDNNVGEFNGKSEIYFMDFTKGGALPQMAKVIAQQVNNSPSSTSCLNTESDIQINTKYRLARVPSGSNKIEFTNLKGQLFEYGGSDENLTSTVMHEMGHTAGLDHEGDVRTSWRSTI